MNRRLGQPKPFPQWKKVRRRLLKLPAKAYLMWGTSLEGPVVKY